MEKIYRFVVKGILAVEKEIFFLTGIELPLLKEWWKFRGEYIQHLLDQQKERTA